MVLFSALIGLGCAEEGLGSGGGAGGAATGGATSSGGAGGKTTATDAGSPPTCSVGGKTYQIGESFKLDCNTCTCTPDGVVCTEMACLADGGADLPPTDTRLAPDSVAAPATDTGSSSCRLSSNLTFGHNGGMVIYQDENRLTATTFTITRSYMRGAGPDGASASTCSPKLPACGAAGVVSVATIDADLADAEVQAAFKSAQSSGRSL